MYRHENDHIYTVANIEETNNNKITPLEHHEIFSDCMRACIKRAYGGKIPSYAIIARDFSLRSRDGTSISSESIRKWMTGKTLPHAQRLSELVNWLGPDIAFSLGLNSYVLNGEKNSDVSGSDISGVSSPLNHSEIDSDNYLFKQIQNLSYRDKKIMMSILHTFKKTKQN